MNERAKLIQTLSQELKPVKRVGHPHFLAILLIAVTWILLVLEFGVSGGFRPTFALQLESSPRFLLESLAAWLAPAAAMLAVISMSIPGTREAKWLRATSIGLVVLFAASLLYGMVSPPLEASMLGKRHNCHIETVLFGILPAAVVFYFVRSLAPLRRLLTGTWIGIASMLPGAAMMQFACMYDPTHNFLFHFIPSLLGIALVWGISTKILPRI